MNKFSCLLLLCVLAVILVPGSDHIVLAQAPHPLPDGENLSLSTEDVGAFDCSLVTDVPESECEALVDFYINTNGAGWTNSTNWLISTEVDSWFGVSVTGGHVTLIELNGNGLSGDLPETLSQIPYLIELCLTNNQITGSLPESLNQIGTLERLSLDFNQLSGSIPEWLALMPKLTKISLGHNQLSGKIPPALGDLPVLQKLEFHDNEISGELPDSLGNLSTLLNLIINNNPIEGTLPLNFTALTSLDYFYFYGTRLCEPSDPEFMAWKSSVLEWNGTDVICMDHHCFMPIIIQ